MHECVRAREEACPVCCMQRTRGRRTSFSTSLNLSMRRSISLRAFVMSVLSLISLLVILRRHTARQAGRQTD